MAKQTFTRWISLQKKGFNPLLRKTYEIFLISEYHSKKLIPPLLQKYFSNINIDKSLQDFSLIDILFRSFRFAGRPKKENLTSKDRFKRKIIQLFHEDHERTANIWNLVDLIFLPSPKKCMFIASMHIVEMFAAHFPEYKIFELSGHTNALRNRLIYILAQISQKRFQDSSEGTTVFANLADSYLLKAYRLLHPNKKIYLRFHDSFKTIEKNTSLDELRKRLHLLVGEKVIYGVESYYQNDAESLDILYRPNAVNAGVMEKLNKKIRNYLYIFVGTHKSRTDHSRLKSLNVIRERLCELYPSASRYINERIISDLSERITYHEYLELISLSEIVVDMYRITPYEGFSFRIPEALLLERKIITNRLNILDCDFYDPSRFFVIGHDPIDRLKDFVENDFKPLPVEIKNRYDCSHWWKNIP